MSAKVVADVGCTLGEGPLWHPKEQVLYFVDIPEGRLHRYDPAAGSCECVHEGRPISAVTYQANGSLLLFRDKGRIDVFEGGRVTRTLVERIEREADTRFNDVVADPAGRVFAGTMPTDDRPGSLYRFDPDGSIHLLLDDVALPNGMGFSEDMKLFYLVDSGRQTVWEYNYDERTGRLRGTLALIEVSGEMHPDGLIVDAEDHLWVGLWGGGAAARYSPRGKLVDHVKVEASHVTSMAFGGAELTRLFITTAIGEGEARGEDEPHAGALFEGEAAGAVGRLEFPSRLGL